ncbi:MAG TPA: alpha/beta hydrolase [Candidatus Dormibacteraeota bacterium]|nr:alpha/beta hydrolase [Candidatus Dormibacteraeota bacterium]
MNAITSNHKVTVAGLGILEVTVSERGEGAPYLLLHGGGGPLTMSGFADLLASQPARVITPTHPGFAGTPRPDSLHSVRGLAGLYVALLDALELQDVTVVGNSMGGWIAAEMALLNSPRAVRFVIVDAVGIEVPGNPVVDFFSLTPRQVAEHSYHDPDKFGIDPTKLPPEALQAMAGNRATLTVYAGTSMNDPSLAQRLRGVTRPTLVLWGDADRIANVDYGRAFAAAIPRSEFRLLENTGHLPQIETPAQLLDAIRAFVQDGASARPA